MVLYHNEGVLSASGLFSTVVERVILEDIGVEPTNSVLFFKAFDDSGETVSEGFKLFSPPKELQLKRPNISFTLDKTKERYVLTVETDIPVLYCFIETHKDIVFSDNYFSFAGGKKVITFIYDGELKKDDFKICSLCDLLA